MLAWDGCVNVRDLGGLQTEDGARTRHRVLVRADSIRGLTEQGWSALLAYGVRSAVDLRADREVTEDPGDDAPIPVTRVPIAPTGGAAWTWPTMREAYLALLAEFRPEFSQAVAAVARAETPVVVHCLGGRDRTGLTVALLLRLAGVDPVTIAADHALSDESWGPHNEAWFAEAPDEEERARRLRIAAPAGQTMASVLSDVERRYGGPRAYLEGGGAPSEDIDTIVVRLRGCRD